jgi:hypothetical protein
VSLTSWFVFPVYTFVMVYWLMEFVQGLKKTIPGAPENQTPVHLRPKQIYAQFPGPQY